MPGRLKNSKFYYPNNILHKAKLKYYKEEYKIDDFSMKCQYIVTKKKADRKFSKNIGLNNTVRKIKCKGILSTFLYSLIYMDKFISSYYFCFGS